MDKTTTLLSFDGGVRLRESKGSLKNYHSRKNYIQENLSGFYMKCFQVCPTKEGTKSAFNGFSEHFVLFMSRTSVSVCVPNVFPGSESK